MEIQHGKDGTLPFFAIVPPGEESLGYAMLARHMGPEQTVYKVQGHAPVTGRASALILEHEMQALTEEYVAAMRRRSLTGRIAWGVYVTEPTSRNRLCLDWRRKGKKWDCSPSLIPGSCSTARVAGCGSYTITVNVCGR